MNHSATTIRVDDLQPGDWYRFTLPLGASVDAQWFGLDGRAGLLREEGSIHPEFWPCQLIASCEIEAIHAPMEIIDADADAAIREVMAEEDEPLPLSPREARWVTLAIIGGCIFWGCIILYAIGR